MNRRVGARALTRPSMLLAAGALALAAVLACPGGAAAQRTDWSGYVDSLATRTDTAALRALVPRKAEGATADVLLAVGFAQLRAHQLSAQPRDMANARKLFDRATSRYPDHAWAHYGYALALAGGPGVRLPSPGGVLNAVVTPQSMAQIVGLDPASHARRELRRALRLDPAFSRAAIELVHEATAAHDRDALVDARDALARMRDAQGAAAPAALVLALSDADRELGDVHAAAAVATAAGADAGAAGDYARATALLRDPGHEAEGLRSYMAGIDRLDSLTASRYFADIRYIARDQERDAWARGDLAARKALLQDFWGMRAAVAGVEVAERLANHYRRLAVVEQQYRRDSSRGAPPLAAHTLLPYDAAAPFDDRGVIYLRHGPPDHVVTTPSSELRPNVSWVYEGTGGHAQSFHFIQFPNAPDFRLVDNVLTVLDPTTGDFDPQPMIRFLQDRVAFDAELEALLMKLQTVSAAAKADRMAPGGSGAALQMVGDALQQLQSTAEPLARRIQERTRLALRTDSDEPRFDARLPFYYDLFTFRGAAGRTDLVAALAVPADRLMPVSSSPSVYALRLSLIAVDTAARTVTRVDTTYALRAARPLGKGDYIRVEAQLAAPPSNTVVERLVLRDSASDGTGEAYATSVPLRRYDAAAKLAISDIVLAEPTAGGAWHRGGVSLAPVPPREFPEASFSTFYEIYNLPAGAPFETTIRVEGIDRDAIRSLLGLGGGTVRLAFRGEAQPDADGAVQALRRVSGRLKPGRYRLTVGVSNLATGETATRSREFVVRKRR